jgi:hypothetical protein
MLITLIESFYNLCIYQSITVNPVNTVSVKENYTFFWFFVCTKSFPRHSVNTTDTYELHKCNQYASPRCSHRLPAGSSSSTTCSCPGHSDLHLANPRAYHCLGNARWGPYRPRLCLDSLP